MLIGREAERARIDALLEAARRGRTGVLVLVGEPGIGKTALLDDACARATGIRVLRTTAVESESMLAFSDLHAVLRPVIGLLERLEEPQERALRAALALADADELDLLAVNAGTLSLLAEAASGQPVLVVVDDAHWLDAPSADALAFAARRLAGEELAFLVAVRAGEASAFDRGFEHVELRPLGPEHARELMAARRDPVPSGSAEALVELAAGNPLALLELPASFVDEPLADVTVPDRIRRSFASQLESLSPDARLAAFLAAAEHDPGAVRTAAEALGVGESALAEAESAGLLRLEPGGIEFRHPLLRAIAYSSAELAERRAAHLALAAALTDDRRRDRRAWHLAAAATEPDEPLAALLEETAERAKARGGHAAAAKALVRAAALSQDEVAAARRLDLAARSAFWAGDLQQAIELSERAIAIARDPLTRADAVLTRSSLQLAAPFDEQRVLAAVGDVQELDADRATRLLLEVVNHRMSALDITGALELSPRLEEVARRAGEWWRPRGLWVVAATYLAHGEGARFAELFAELETEPAPMANTALDLVWAERYGAARRALEETLRDGRSSGNRMRVIWNQAALAQLELRVGRLRQAAAAAAESITLAEAIGAARWTVIAQGALAGVHAWHGDADACRETATQAIAAARELQTVVDELKARWALGLLAVGQRRFEETIVELLPSAQRWQQSTLVEPSAVELLPDLVEAYVHTGELESARSWLERFRAAAEQAERRWALAAVARCDGFLAAADDFEQHFERALEILESQPLSLDRARTELAYGERLRRAGRRREARAHLRAAHEAFATVDAAPWADRAAAELRATGESVGPRTPDRRTSLTPQELQIALHVSEGLTNKEIASRLYLSPKTIEYHLSNAYRKLDVHSRAELTRIVAEGAWTEGR